MATELLAPGSTSAASSDFDVADGATVTLCLTGPNGDNAPVGASVAVQIKGPGGTYYDVGQLSGSGARSTTVASPGTYRVSRPAGPVCGAFRN